MLHCWWILILALLATSNLLRGKVIYIQLPFPWENSKHSLGWILLSIVFWLLHHSIIRILHDWDFSVRTGRMLNLSCRLCWEFHTMLTLSFFLFLKQWFHWTWLIVTNVILLPLWVLTYHHKFTFNNLLGNFDSIMEYLQSRLLIYLLHELILSLISLNV